MTALASTRRRRTAVMLAINLTAIVALGGMGYAGYRALRRYEGGKNVSVPVLPVPRTQVGMLATVDGDDELTTVTVFVLSPPAQGEVGGSIVSVPVSSDTAFGFDGMRIPLTEVYSEGGADSLVLGVESLLSITLDQWQVADPAAAAALLAPLEPVAVDLPAAVTTDDSGAEVTLFEAGEVNLSAEEVVSVLNASPEGTPERSRRANVEAVWGGVAEAVGAGVTEVPAEPLIGSLGDLADRLFASTVASRGLATTILEAADNPDGKDVEALDRADVVWVFGSIAPSATTAPTTGLTYRIEAPPGYDERVKWAITLVLYFGHNVQSVLVSEVIPTRTATEIELYDASFEEDVAESDQLFGEVQFVEPESRVAGVDVVLRLGSDFLDGTVDSGETLPSTTTSTTQA